MQHLYITQAGTTAVQAAPRSAICTQYRKTHRAQVCTRWSMAATHQLEQTGSELKPTPEPTHDPTQSNKEVTMQTMTIIEALTLVHNTLKECTIPLRDAAKAGGAMELLEKCITTMKNEANAAKEDQQ